MKIALALICKDTQEEANYLDQCLKYASPHVAGIFITQTGEGKYIPQVAKKYRATVSDFKWINDFAAARNFNFAQVPKDYDYILWCDADDVFRGLENVNNVLKKNPKDAYAMWYLYAFDEDKQPIVSHKKVQIVKNDGTFQWVGRIHEDLQANREVSMFFIEGIDRLHMTTTERVVENSLRNLEIAKLEFKQKKTDPRSNWNLANAYSGAGQSAKALTEFKKFMKRSLSEDEKYIALLRMGGIYKDLGKRDECVETMLKAVGLKHQWPDAYLQLGRFYFEWNDMDKAEEYTLAGIVKQPSLHSMIVFNPRDYDYNPMQLLAKIYFNKSRPDLALVPLKKCLEIAPHNKRLQDMVSMMEKEKNYMIKALEAVKKITDETPKEEAIRIINAVPKDVENHPFVCSLRNRYVVRETTSGKDVAIFCGVTTFEWNPILFKQKGFGGSEEAVIHLSRFLASKGLNVTVYNNCGIEPLDIDGVKWMPYWRFNSRDAWDYLILWRSPKLCDYDLNAKNIFIDLHDVVNDGEFTKERLKKITKVFVKSEFHASLFPSIPREKIRVIPNGINTKEFSPAKKEKLIINTSSPDRSLSAFIKICREVKKAVPDVVIKWAYGWDLFAGAHQGNPPALKWMEQMNKELAEVGIEPLGKIPQTEIAKLYEKAKVFLYPTEFAEIDCISVKKAQLAGAYPVVSDFAALKETAQHGSIIHSKKTKDNWTEPYQFDFSMQTDHDKFVKETINAVNSEVDTKPMREWAKKLDWANIGQKWYNEF